MRERHEIGIKCVLWLPF